MFSGRIGESGTLGSPIECEKDINLLESLYNIDKELRDQHKLDTDLKELAECVVLPLVRRRV